jgi:hypothetical protein
MFGNEVAALRRGSSTAHGLFSRRRLLGTTTLAVAGVALAAEAGAQQPQSVRTHYASGTDPGPENEALRTLNPNSFTPPPTVKGERASSDLTWTGDGP